MNITKSKKIIPLNDDDMFTQVFNDKKLLPVIEEFIADYFGYDLNDVRGHIKIKPRRLLKDKIQEKGKELDLLLDYKGKKIDIEMSTGITASTIKRNIMFISKVHSSQADVGDKYKDIRDTIQINLLAKDRFNELKLSFSFANIDKKIILSEFPRIDMISMEIGKNLCYTGNEETDKLIKWSKIFMSETKEELNAILEKTVSTESKEILIETVSRLSGDEEMIKKYEEKSKWQITQEMMMEDYQEEAEKAKEELKSIHQELEKSNQELEKSNQELEKSNQELEKSNQELEKSNQELEKSNQELEKVKNELNNKQLEIAKNALENNIDIDTVVKITNLTKEEVLELK